MQENIPEVKKHILSILKVKGPSLPVQIASEVKINSLFVGAILSELGNNKLLKISNMKVGGSPLYYLQGQETGLEKFHSYLDGKEKETFLLLKQKKILEDKTQLPAIRVALRNLKDFSISFTKDNEIWWRFHTATEEEIKELLEPKKEEVKELPTKVEIKKEPVKIVEEVIPKTEIVKEIKKEPNKPQMQPIKIESNKQLNIGLKSDKQEKQQMPKEKPEFALQIINLLKQNKIEILEEKEVKKREFSCIIKINSDLGKIKLLCIAKDKKSITENDLKLILQQAQTLKMPALVLFPGEINKKALEYAESCPLLKLKKFS